MASMVRVRRIALRAPRRELIGRAAVAIEDALRTASLPAAATGELLLVRRIDLGVIRAGAAPQSLALRLEAALRGIRTVRVVADERAPEAAEAVCFSDATEALAALLVAAQRGALRDWWWPRVLPEAATSHALPILAPRAFAAAVKTDGPAGVGALLGRLLRLDSLDAVLAVLPADVVTGPAVSVERIAPAPAVVPSGILAIPAAGGHPTAPAAGRAMAGPAAALVAMLPVAWREALRRWIVRWGVQDPRSAWIVAAALRETFGPAAVPVAGPVLQALAADVALLAAPPVPMLRRVVAWQRHPLQLRPPLRGEIAPAAASSNPPAVFRTPAPDPPPESVTTWLSTANAGLLFLIPALARLGIDALDPTQPDLPLRLLRFLAARLRIRPEDPILASLPHPLPLPEPARFVAQFDWLGLLGLGRSPRLAVHRMAGEPGRRAVTIAGGRLLAGLMAPATVPALQPWRAHAALNAGHPLTAQAPEDRLMMGLTLVVSRLLRRHAATGLRRLVRRPGLLQATATRIDLMLDASWVDIDVRCAGFDLDPGPVAWLGKTIMFHYNYETP